MRKSIVIGIWEPGWNLQKSRNQDGILGYNVEIDGRADTVGELMKRTFCRPYGTDPGVHIIRPSSKLLGYYQLSLRDKECRVPPFLLHVSNTGNPYVV